ncbi:ribosome biogenesis GTPase YlqF [Xylocopilactobacillus apicola]|uniref:Ribosome biogenesis GTPase A n=1 Tax=Xylocopilactobacillus apicola TaxID=2932184 RepID=A0AAU9DNI7_9LACO|nr:ribosome biogenesis GTPase YlqF [Xylocopilactobacillus apicola]BDR58647.1 ribosome biogenesis GTPase A [Xylocopilactobacillus apicola]
MTGEWFPGHMAKTKRLLTEKKREIDLALILIDARAPISSINQYLNEVFNDKPKIYLLNKCDLADPVTTQLWINEFEKQGKQIFKINAKKGTGVRSVVKAAEETVLKSKKRYAQLGLKNIPVRATLLGIPNIGKSTLLNRFVRKNVAIAQNKPGLTRNLLWYKVNDHFKILDTPGMLWPKFDEPETGYKIALLNSIANYVYDPEKVTDFLLSTMAEHYPEQSLKYFNSCNSWIDFLQQTKFEDSTNKAQEIIRNFWESKYGSISLEWPNE